MAKDVPNLPKIHKSTIELSLSKFDIQYLKKELLKIAKVKKAVGRPRKYDKELKVKKWLPYEVGRLVFCLW